MAGRFRRTWRGSLECRLAPEEIAVLRRLLGELLALLTSRDREDVVPDAPDPLERLVGIGSSSAPPADPVLARLLPDGYADDEASAAEFRRFTEASLRSGKEEAARAVLADLDAAQPTGRVVLPDPARASVWLRALNDLRLALGTRLEVTEDSYDELERLPLADPRGATYRVYAWLGWLQETLVRSLT